MKKDNELIEQITRSVLEELSSSGYPVNGSNEIGCSRPQAGQSYENFECEVISSEDMEKLQNITSPNICNAIESFKVRDETDGYSTSKLKCMRPELKPMVGYAITVSVDSTSPSSLEKRKFFEKFGEIMDLIKNSPKPSVVVFKDIGPQSQKCCVTGDMVSTCFSSLGAAGVVTDSCIRDLSGIREKTKDFQIFATGQVVSHGTLNILEIGSVVNICGTIIRPGDLLHGDESGLVNIPINFISIKKLIDKCEQVMQIEKRYFDFMKSDRYNFEEMKKYFIE